MVMTVGRAARIAFFAALIPACSVKLDDPAGFIQPDAATDAPGLEASIDAEEEEEPDAAMITIDAPRCSARQVVMVFDGITLTRGATNALTKSALWIGEDNQGTTRDVPSYRNGDGTRETAIAGIMTEVQARLAQFPLTVIRATETTLPTTGEFIMVVVGGTAADVGSNFGQARNLLDCGDAAPNDIAWIADNAPIDEIDDLAVGAIAYGLGLGGTSAGDNCLCQWRTNCTKTAGNCTLSTAAQATNAQDVCGQTPNPQNQIAAFETAFCQ
jgi:hypothetical protein